MSKCEYLENCPFFKSRMAHIPEAAEKLKDYYCNKHYLKCARFIHKKIAGENDPDLLPNSLEELSEKFGWGLKKS